jgi:hypothetical protein
MLEILQHPQLVVQAEEQVGRGWPHMQGAGIPEGGGKGATACHACIHCWRELAIKALNLEEACQHINIRLLQVLVFVLTYVQRHELSKATVHALFECIRLPYLSNERLAQLSQVGSP